MLTRADLAKYPFVAEATDYVRELGFSIDEIATPEFSPVLDRAERRLEEALSKSQISVEVSNESAEILSFPVSNLILGLIGDERARRRFALAEAKRAYDLLRQESPEKLEHIATTTFGWRLERLDIRLGLRLYDFGLNLADFLRNSVHLREPRWNLWDQRWRGPGDLLSNGSEFLLNMNSPRFPCRTRCPRASGI